MFPFAGRSGNAAHVEGKKYSKFKYTPFLLVQIVLVILFFVFCQYEGKKKRTEVEGFEGTHVMIFIGFGFLMTFLKKYSYSALGLNWFLAAISIQWAILWQNFFHMKDNKILISKDQLMEADIMAATVLITFGVVLGVASGVQLLFISLVEVAIGCVNIWLVTDIFKAADVGGSIAIHTFGAYFGVGVSLALRHKSSGESSGPNLNAPSYVSDVTAMIGSIFLWIYWPSFNSGLTESDASYERAVVNTYLSLASATVTSFVVSSMVNHDPGKFDMVHVQNSTLAGGVAVGAVCNMMIGCGAAVLIGVGAGIISVIGYRYITPFLEKKCGLLDTCGVNNLHGMPGIFSGILSIIFASLASKETYGKDLEHVFEAMNERTGLEQAAYQAAALGATFAISLVSGYVTGLISKLFEELREEQRYNDELNWELPEDTK